MRIYLLSLSLLITTTLLSQEKQIEAKPQVVVATEVSEVAEDLILKLDGTQKEVETILKKLTPQQRNDIFFLRDHYRKQIAKEKLLDISHLEVIFEANKKINHQKVSDLVKQSEKIQAEEAEQDERNNFTFDLRKSDAWYIEKIQLLTEETQKELIEALSFLTKDQKNNKKTSEILSTQLQQMINGKTVKEVIQMAKSKKKKQNTTKTTEKHK